MLTFRTRKYPESAHSLDYRPEIDGLRAIAVLAVVGFHAYPDLVPGGFVGVDMFFVISGFLITHIILRELSQNTFSFVDFYSRRARRIFPALLITLLTTSAVGWLTLLPDVYRLLGKHTAAAAGFLLNLELYSDSDWYCGESKSSLLHLWYGPWELRSSSIFFGLYLLCMHLGGAGSLFCSFRSSRFSRSI